MNIRRVFSLAGAFACLTLLTTAAWAVDPGKWSYAAIAFAPSTGNFRYSYNYLSQEDAEWAALSGMREKDAKIVAWVNQGFCALALGDDLSAYGSGYQRGDGASNHGAMDNALRNCRDVTKNAKVVLCLLSDGSYIYQPQDSKIPGTENQHRKRYPNVDPFRTVTPLNQWLESNSHVPSTPQTNPLLPRNRLAPQLNPLGPVLDPSLQRFFPDDSQFNPLLPQLNPEPSVFP